MALYSSPSLYWVLVLTGVREVTRLLLQLKYKPSCFNSRSLPLFLVGTPSTWWRSQIPLAIARIAGSPNRLLESPSAGGSLSFNRSVIPGSSEGFHFHFHFVERSLNTSTLVEIVTNKRARNNVRTSRIPERNKSAKTDGRIIKLVGTFTPLLIVPQNFNARPTNNVSRCSTMKNFLLQINRFVSSAGNLQFRRSRHFHTRVVLPPSPTVWRKTRICFPGGSKFISGCCGG